MPTYSQYMKDKAVLLYFSGFGEISQALRASLKISGLLVVQLCGRLCTERRNRERGPLDQTSHGAPAARWCPDVFNVKDIFSGLKSIITVVNGARSCFQSTQGQKLGLNFSASETGSLM